MKIFQEKSDSFHKDLAQRLANLRSNLDEQASKFVLSSEHQAYVDEFSASLLATESKLEKQIQEKLKEVQNQQGSFVTKDQAMVNLKIINFIEKTNHTN
jgi:superoxide dismutase